MSDMNTYVYLSAAKLASPDSCLVKPDDNQLLISFYIGDDSLLTIRAKDAAELRAAADVLATLAMRHELHDLHSGRLNNTLEVK